ncbi:MAG: bifunctional diaminohydroxyphosphoribosylaminopyrimidine deaminase/5-amino-6-(5-phosphoribosylamino)uracil reductase RibD [Ignavibacteriales bacterium]|nr:MAG: bifunctional diaminohydroxyphosphoribosylaminopyrimidine deaminase/5-amino-6-(5-phosphoribosylamino)uracil reductase RibD [Ignavibacteriales bacterium]
MTDESYIQLAIEIAKRGIGYVSPNPLVGCIIVKDDRIVGAGYHEKFGENHAEINAISSSRENLEGTTLFVNLEPCSHTGKTPPCVDKIIEHKIKRVVIGTLDMNPLVSGKGIRKLKSAGVEVKVGVLEKECIQLNRFFFKHITKKIPYVTIKAAQTVDGKIADIKGNSKWISSIESRRYVHNLRSQYDAILIGAGTANKDNPLLTVRLTEGRNPRRIVVDTNLVLKTTHKLLTNNHDSNLIIITSKNSIDKKRKVKKLISQGAHIIYSKSAGNGYLDLKYMLKELGKLNLNSILVEGGSKLFTSFFQQNLYDNFLIFLSPKLIGSGVPLTGDLGVKNIKDIHKLKLVNSEKIGEDVLIELSK